MKPPTLKHIVLKSRHKPRVSMVGERTVLALVKGPHKLLDGPPKARDDASEVEGIYFLSTNRVLEVYKAKDGTLSGFLFCNLDTWLSFDPEPDPETFL